MFSLKGKKVLLTGASGGIGQAVALHLAKQGAELALSGTREASLSVLSQEISDRFNTKAVPITCALDHADAGKVLFEKADEALSGIDILINNAGITRDTLLIRMKDEDWQAVLDVNLNTVFRLCKNAILPMMKRRYGRVINMSSVVGVAGNPGQTNYCASKAGLIGFSKALAQEVASRGITVNCIAPGFIETDMTKKLPDQIHQKIKETIPLGYMGHVDDIAAAVVYLASDEARYVTGQTLHVNGGMLMV